MEALKDRPEIINLIGEVAEVQGINNHVITEVKTNDKGEGFLGQIFMVSLKDPATEQQLHIVVKAAFTDEQVRNFAPIRKSFENEVYFYTTILPLFNGFGQTRGLEEEKFVPKCYKVSLEETKEMLCLENLKEKGFEVFNKKSVLDEDHIELIFKRYGRFHAYSFALRDQEPEAYEELTQKLHNMYAEFFMREGGGFSEHLQRYSVEVQGYFKTGEDDEIIQRYKKYTGDGIADIFKQVVTQECQHSVILHGDCWSNNMMFKYEESDADKKIVDMRLLDLQIIRNGSPVCDLSYCLYSGASKAVFDQLDSYLKIYYESLSTTLRQLGSDPEKLFPFDILKRDWKKYARFGMITSMMVLKMKAVEKEDIIDFTDGIDEKEYANAFATMKFDEETYRRRIRELFYHLLEIDAL